MSSGRRRFRIIKEIAEGGFGKVFLAEQISSDGFSRIVAVKLLHAKWSTHDEVVMRTRDEARLLGLIRHQHIVKVEDLTSINGMCAIVMEYLEGCDLKWMNHFLKERGIAFPRTALFEIILGAASALDAGFNGRPLQGGDPLRVIHRDIKPSNVFVTVAGGVKVLDFGTARANFDEREAKTQALAFGSQGYMAPERLLGEPDTDAADVFSLGITLYECLTLESFGRIPPRPSKFAAKVEEKVAAIPLAGDPEWGEQVRDTLRLMLSYEPAERPTAAQLVEIMELLAQDAGDMGLRRFCRTLVAEAKANLPDPDSADELIGTVVEEDASEMLNKLPAPDLSNTEATQTGAMLEPVVGPPDFDAPTVRAEAPPKPARPAPAPPPPAAAPPVASISPAAQAAAPPAPKKRSGGLGLMVGGVAFLGVLAVLAVVVIGIVGVVMSQQGTTDTTDGAAAAAVTPADGGEDAPAGSAVEVSQPDGTVATLMKYSDPAGAEMELKGKQFKATWDGKAPLDVGKLRPGNYKSTIKSGGRHSFSVPDDVTACTFTFDAVGEEWQADCK